MSPHQDRSSVHVRRLRQNGSSRGTVRLGTRSLLRPTTRRVTFEVVSSTSSRRHQHREPETRSPVSPVAAAAAVNTLPSSGARQLCQIREIPSGNRDRRSGPGYLDPAHDSLGSLLMRRMQNRHQRAWTRKRYEHEHGVVTRSTGCLSPKLQCLVCGVLFVAVLTTYLTLSINIHLATSLHVILILLLLLCTILFFHGFFRTWLMNRRLRLHNVHSHRPSHSRHRHRRTNIYAEPRSPFDILPSDDSLYTPTTPVRVHLFRDEEALLGEKETATTQDINLDSPYADDGASERALPTPPPPAYGLWRCSVRADPNLLHWARCGDDGRPIELDAEATTRAASNPNENRRASINSLPYYSGDDEGLDLEAGDISGPEHPSLGLLAGELSDPQNRGVGLVVPEDDWPLRTTNGAVQEVTRMLLEDQRRHSMF